MNVLSSQKQELLDRVGQLIVQTQGIDIGIPEESGMFSIEDDMVKHVRSVVRETSDLLLVIMECYDGEAASPGGASDISATDDEAFLKEIGAQISSQLAVEEVSGLAFVSRGQLLDTMAIIDDAIASRQTWKVASYIDTGLRRSGRALVAIESAIRECEGLPVEYRQWQSLDDSLEVRRIYGEFRRSILDRAGADPDVALEGNDLLAALNHAAESIAKLRSLEIYPFLRIDDRLPIRRLQKRILRWLEENQGLDESQLGESEGAASENGGLLWSDLVSFARLLTQVNHRQEIREHDRLAVNGLLRRFFEGGEPPGALTPDMVSLLEALQGREDELDRIILEPDGYRGDDVQIPLERLRKELGQPFETRPHSDFLQSHA